MGEGLQEEMQQGKRQRLFITSKVWNDAHRPDAVRCGAATSLVFTDADAFPGRAATCQLWAGRRCMSLPSMHRQLFLAAFCIR